MSGHCIRCKQFTNDPLTVESVDRLGRTVYRAVFCPECHETMVSEQQEVKK